MQYNIAPAATNRTNVSLSHNHISTIDFNQVNVVQVTDCIIGDEHHNVISPFVRLAPLAVPTFGNFSLHLCTFFVPYYQVFKYFDAFITGGNSVGNIQTRQLPMLQLYDLYRSLILNTDCVEVTDGGHTDIVIDTGSAQAPEVHGYRFGRRAKQIYKILCSLGYPATDLASYGDSRTHAFNALPLLCFFKGFNDWLTMSATYSQSDLTAFLQDPYQRIGSTLINHDSVISILDNYIHPLIGSDYFTSAYNAPINAVNLSSNPQVDLGFFDKLRNQIVPENSVSTNPNENSIYINNQKNVLSEYTLKFLRSFDSFVRRNQLAGTRPAQRILAAFGLKSEDFRSNYAHLVNHAVIPFNVADVTSTAANADPALGLGTYAGQSIASGKYEYNYKCDDFGCLITIAFVDVKAQYRSAISALALKQTNLDFYQPDFDGVGLMPISRAQLYCNPTLGPNMEIDAGHINSVFGFVPRYEEYRSEFDKVSGDFLIYDTMDSWHFARNFAQSNALRKALPQSHDFQFTGNEFDRIFTAEVSDNEDVADHFFCVFNINHSAVRPIKSRAGSIDMKEGQIQIASHGKTIQEM